MAIYTDNGLTLFDTRPRTVTFESHDRSSRPRRQARAVVVDGVADHGQHGPDRDRAPGASPPSPRSAIRSPSPTRASSTRLRAVWSRSARRERSERDPEPCPMRQVSSPGAARRRCRPAAPCRWGWPARSRSIATVDPAQGGDPARLRDGGISNPGNPAYVYNATGATGYSDRLNQMLDALDAAASLRPGGASGLERDPVRLRLVLGCLAAGGAQIRERRRGLQEHSAGAVLRGPVQRHRRQPR